MATLRASGTLVATVPLACYPAATGCAAVESELRAAARDAAPRLASVSCSGEGVCTCREALRDEEVAETGTYLATGSRVILTSAGGDATTDEYCVSGNELRLQASMSSVAPAPAGGGAPDVLILGK